jgi:hypothetical protein
VKLRKPEYLIFERGDKNGMALEDFTISDLCYHGAGSIFLYYLAVESSRSKMVRVRAKKENEGGKCADIGRCDSNLSMRNHVCPGPHHRNWINSATGE